MSSSCCTSPPPGSSCSLALLTGVGGGQDGERAQQALLCPTLTNAGRPEWLPRRQLDGLQLFVLWAPSSVPLIASDVSAHSLSPHRGVKGHTLPSFFFPLPLMMSPEMVSNQITVTSPANTGATATPLLLLQHV